MPAAIKCGVGVAGPVDRGALARKRPLAEILRISHTDFQLHQLDHPPRLKMLHLHLVLWRQRAVGRGPDLKWGSVPGLGIGPVQAVE